MAASYNHFTCRTYKKDGEACTAHYIRECVLDEVVLEDLRRVTAIAREHTQEFAEYINGRQSAEIQREIRRQEKELAAMRKRSDELAVIFKRLYEDSVLGRITPEQFRVLSGSYTEEQAALKAEIPKKESAIQSLRDQVSGADSASRRSSIKPMRVSAQPRYSSVPESVWPSARVAQHRITAILAYWTN